MSAVITTRSDAIIGVIEDVILTGGAGLGAWLATHNAGDVVVAAGATHGGKSLVALGLSAGRTGRLAKALKLINQVLTALATQVPPSDPTGVKNSL